MNHYTAIYKGRIIDIIFEDGSPDRNEEACAYLNESSRIRIGASCIKEGCLVDELSMYRQLYFEARQFNLSSVLSTYIPDQKVDIIRSGGIESVVNADGIVRPTFRLDTGLVGAYPAVYFNRQSYFPRAYITFVAKKNHDGIFPKVFHWVSSVQPFPRSLESMPTLEEYDARGMSWVTNNLDRYTGNMRKENGENRLYQRQYLAILPSFYADSRFSIINSSEPHLVRYTFRSISDDDSKLIVRVEVCIKDEWIEHYYFHIDLARADYLSGQQ